ERRAGQEGGAWRLGLAASLMMVAYAVARPWRGVVEAQRRRGALPAGGRGGVPAGAERGGHQAIGGQSSRHGGSPRDAGLGREATTPTQIPKRGWIDILKRTWAEMNEDHADLIAAGVAFYIMLALVPALTAGVALYGLFADPATIADHMNLLEGVLPGEAVTLLSDQLRNLAATSDSSLSIGALVSLLLALWSARSGAGSMISALNIAYEEQEKRGFIRFQLTAIVFTISALAFMVVSVGTIAVLPTVLEYLPLGETLRNVLGYLRWPLLAGAALLGLALLYRFAPCRASPRWSWVTWGSGVATVLWLAASAAFSVYVNQFAKYNESYGSLGTAVVLLLWLYITAYIVMAGAELNAEMEHQTAQDTTDGHPKPMGHRKAKMADTVAEPSR
ncbi:MAG TPA: YihY/virulence factor BrkB family protein, partial [Alphaproteobacteria bacterium]|nr:YihY/virulence factor BrkB family protein [Alphaproteobacteria bacterium]